MCFGVDTFPLLGPWPFGPRPSPTLPRHSRNARNINIYNGGCKGLCNVYRCLHPVSYKSCEERYGKSAFPELFNYCINYARDNTEICGKPHNACGHKILKIFVVCLVKAFSFKQLCRSCYLVKGFKSGAKKLFLEGVFIQIGFYTEAPYFSPVGAPFRGDFKSSVKAGSPTVFASIKQIPITSTNTTRQRG